MRNLKEKLRLTYLKAIKVCKNKGWFHSLKRFETILILNDLRERSGKPRLNGTGPFGSLMFIGTNPSIRSRLENPWEDPFGKYFGDFLREAGISPEEIYFTNLYKYPTNDNRPLTEEEISLGREELMLEIKMVDPTMIIPLGKQSMEQFDGEIGKITKFNSFDIFGLDHPSYVKRFPEKKVEFIKNLKIIKKINDEKRICKESLRARDDGRGDYSSPSEGRSKKRGKVNG